jgi:hypothetical protein
MMKSAIFLGIAMLLKRASQAEWNFRQQKSD